MKITKKQIKNLKKQYPRNSIERRVLNECLKYSDEPEDFFKDVLTYGCSDGIIGILTYTEDTHKFFDKYYGVIMDMVEDYRDNTGYFVNTGWDIKNDLAWFAFEEVSRQLANELGIDY